MLRASAVHDEGAGGASAENCGQQRPEAEELDAAYERIAELEHNLHQSAEYGLRLLEGQTTAEGEVARLEAALVEQQQLHAEQSRQTAQRQREQLAAAQALSEELQAERRALADARACLTGERERADRAERQYQQAQDDVAQAQERARRAAAAAARREQELQLSLATLQRASEPLRSKAELADALQEENSTLQSKLARSREDAQGTESTLATLRAQLARAEATLASVEQSREELHSRCCELNETVADLEDQLTQASLQSASAAHGAAGKAAAAATLSNDLVADSEYHKQIAQLEELTARCRAQEAQISNLQTQLEIQRKETELFRTQGAHASERAQKASADLRQLRKAMSDNKTAVRAANADVDADQVQRERRASLEKVTALQRRVEERDAALLAAARRETDLRSGLLAANSKICHQSELASYLQDHMHEVERLCQEAPEFAPVMERYQREIAQLKDDLKASRKSNLEKQAQLTSLEIDMQKLTKALRSIELPAGDMHVHGAKLPREEQDPVPSGVATLRLSLELEHERQQRRLEALTSTDRIVVLERRLNEVTSQAEAAEAEIADLERRLKQHAELEGVGTAAAPVHVRDGLKAALGTARKLEQAVLALGRKAEPKPVVVARYAFAAQSTDQLSVAKGARLRLLNASNAEWWLVRVEREAAEGDGEPAASSASGRLKGFVPASYLRMAKKQPASPVGLAVALVGELQSMLAAWRADAQAADSTNIVQDGCIEQSATRINSLLTTLRSQLS